MKLYSTTTSERASKNQGGNKFIDIELTAGRDRTVMIQISLQHEETETEDIYKLWNGDILVDTLREIKGKRQKGEAVCMNCNSVQKAKDINYLGDSKWNCPNCI